MQLLPVWNEMEGNECFGGRGGFIKSGDNLYTKKYAWMIACKPTSTFHLTGCPVWSISFVSVKVLLIICETGNII